MEKNDVTQTDFNDKKATVSSGVSVWEELPEAINETATDRIYIKLEHLWTWKVDFRGQIRVLWLSGEIVNNTYNTPHVIVEGVFVTGDFHIHSTPVGETNSVGVEGHRNDIVGGVMVKVSFWGEKGDYQSLRVEQKAVSVVDFVGEITVHTVGL